MAIVPDNSALYRALSTRLLKEQFARQLRRLASERITLSELAIRVGYESLSGLQAAMNGKAQPPLHVLIGLAVELEVHSIEELFGDFGTYTAIVDQVS